MKEQIEWIDVAQQLPDDDFTVLVNHPTLNEPVWLGYHHNGFWYTPDGMQLQPNAVTHWAEMPTGTS